MDRRRGFTLIELMIVVAILGILAAVAIPQYLGYMKISKENALQANFEIGAGLIRNEIAKRNAGGQPYLSTPAEFVAELNRGEKKSPYDHTLSAFTSAGNGAGTVVIAQPTPTDYQVQAFDHTGNPRAGNNIAIRLE